MAVVPFFDQAIRLLRENWANPKQLAEELFSMIRTDQPLVINQPVQIIQKGQTPAITIINNDGGTQTIITRTGSDTAPIGGGGAFTPDEIDWDETEEGEENPQAGDEKERYSTGILIGEVVSGSGDQYLCKLWNANPESFEFLGTARVYQLQIHEDEVIPPGTRALVLASIDNESGAASFFMQVPVWL